MQKEVELAFDVYQEKDTDLNLSPILVIHGMFWNKFTFRDLAQQLCKETKRKVFCIDLRNHGESAIREKCDIYVMTEDVIKFIQDRDLKKVSFVCHSFSSTLAYILALKQPDTVEKIVMIDCQPFLPLQMRTYKENVKGAIKMQDRLLSILDSKMGLKEAKSIFYKKASSVGIKAQECFYKKAAYDLTKKDGEFKWKVNFEFLRRTYKEEGFVYKMREPTGHEILICRPPNSHMVTDEMFPDVKKMCPNVKMETFENTSHLLMFEKLEEFVQTVKQFLSK